MHKTCEALCDILKKKLHKRPQVDSDGEDG